MSLLQRSMAKHLTTRCTILGLYPFLQWEEITLGVRKVALPTTTMTTSPGIGEQSRGCIHLIFYMWGGDFWLVISRSEKVVFFLIWYLYVDRHSLYCCQKGTSGKMMGRVLLKLNLSVIYTVAFKLQTENVFDQDISTDCWKWKISVPFLLVSTNMHKFLT